jgi:hypothetical protein
VRTKVPSYFYVVRELFNSWKSNACKGGNANRHGKSPCNEFGTNFDVEQYLRENRQLEE